MAEEIRVTAALNQQRYTVDVTHLLGQRYFEVDYFQNDFFQVGQFLNVANANVLLNQVRTTVRLD